jgi:hypothetical protein
MAPNRSIWATSCSKSTHIATARNRQLGVTPLAKPTHVLWLPRCPVGWHHRGLEPIGPPGPTRLARAPRPPLVLWRYGPLS